MTSKDSCMYLNILPWIALLCLSLLSCSPEQKAIETELEQLRLELNQTRQDIQNLDSKLQAMRQEQLQSLQGTRQDLQQLVQYLQISLDSLSPDSQQEPMPEETRDRIHKSLHQFLDLTDQFLEKLKRELERDLDPFENKNPEQ